ncbi:hypothetical protein [Azospirillum doebereinerae]
MREPQTKRSWERLGSAVPDLVHSIFSPRRGRHHSVWTDRGSAHRHLIVIIPNQNGSLKVRARHRLGFLQSRSTDRAARRETSAQCSSTGLVDHAPSGPFRESAVCPSQPGRTPSPRLSGSRPAATTRGPAMPAIPRLTLGARKWTGLSWAWRSVMCSRETAPKAGDLALVRRLP